MCLNLSSFRAITSSKDPKRLYERAAIRVLRLKLDTKVPSARWSENSVGGGVRKISGGGADSYRVLALPYRVQGIVAQGIVAASLLVSS